MHLCMYVFFYFILCIVRCDFGGGIVKISGRCGFMRHRIKKTENNIFITLIQGGKVVKIWSVGLLKLKTTKRKRNDQIFIFCFNVRVTY